MNERRFPAAVPARGRSWIRWLPLNLAVWILVLVCSGLPLAWLVWHVITTPAVLGELHMDSFRLGLLLRTIGYNALAGGIATLLGLPVALVLGRGRGWMLVLLWFLLPVSLLLPSITYAYGWSQFVRMTLPLWRDWTGLTFAPASPEDVLRCIWSLATWLWPLPAAIVGLALRRMDAAVQQQALLDGALWRVTGRQVLPAVVASMAITTVLAMQEFAVYEPTGISVIATEVRMVFDTGAFSSMDNPITQPILAGGAEPADMALALPDQRARAAAAVVTAIPLLVLIALLIGLAAWTAHSGGGAEGIDQENWPRILNARWLSKLLTLGVLLLAVGAPLVSLVLALRVELDPVKIWREFQPAVLGSVSVALITGTVALVLAALAMTARAPGALLLLAATFLIGGQLLAIAQIRLYNRPWLSVVYNGPPIIVMTYLARFGWIALLAGRSTWSHPWRDLREQAAIDGAGPLATARHVVGPLAWPILGASAVLVAILSLTEVPATVLIRPVRPRLLTPWLMEWVHMLRYDPMIEGSLLLVAVVTGLSLLAVGLGWLGRRGLGARGLGPRAIGRIVVLVVPLLLIGCSDGGQPDAIWCRPGTTEPQLVYPRALAWSAVDDSFVVIDRAARVQRIDSAGKLLSAWRMPEKTAGKPVGVSVGPDGNIYVPDTHYHRVMVYDPQGNLLRQWGSYGREPGQFIFPTDIAFDAKGNVFVSEYGDNDRIQVFTPQGTFQYAFGSFGTGDGQFSRPQSMVIDGDLLYVADSCNHRIVVFRTDGTFVRNMCELGSDPGQLRFPYGLDMGDDGELIVCEFGNNRLQRIDKQTGRGLGVWGVAGFEPGQLAYPWAVAVDHHRGRVVAVDSGNNRLQVLEF